MKVYLIISIATCLISGCVANPKKLTAKLTNAKYASLSNAAIKNAYDKDLSSCKQLALKNVPIPRLSPRRSYTKKPKSYGVYNSWGAKVGTVKPKNSYASAPSLLPMFEAMDRERNSPRNIYRTSINSYTGTCMRSRGWKKSAKN